MAQKNLQELIAANRTLYDSIGRVYCKMLNSYVNFTSEGRLHLIYRGNRKKRNVKEQLYKLTLFPLVVPVIKNSKTIASWRFSDEPASNDVQHYALTCIVGKKPINIRVIIKRTGDGQFNYHSVMKHEDNDYNKKSTKKSHAK